MVPSLESAYDLSPSLSKRYVKQKKKNSFWEKLLIVFLAVVAIVGVVMAVFTGGASLAATGASFLGIAGLILTCAGGLIVAANAIASVWEAFSPNGFNFMRDGLCRGNARLHQILSIAGAAMMIAGGIMSNINHYNCTGGIMFNINHYNCVGGIMSNINHYNCTGGIMFNSNHYNCTGGIMSNINHYNCVGGIMFNSNLYNCTGGHKPLFASIEKAA